jgi:hypothetical protein
MLGKGKMVPLLTHHTMKTLLRCQGTAQNILNYVTRQDERSASCSGWMISRAGLDMKIKKTFLKLLEIKPRSSSTQPITLPVDLCQFINYSYLGVYVPCHEDKCRDEYLTLALHGDKWSTSLQQFHSCEKSPLNSFQTRMARFQDWPECSGQEKNFCLC